MASPVPPLPAAAPTQRASSEPPPRAIGTPRRELRAPFQEKRFEARESLLTELSTGGGEAETMRAALNVCVAALVWLAVHLLLKENAANSGGMLGVGRAGLQLARDLAKTASAVFGGTATVAALLCVAALHGLAALSVPLLQLLTRGGRAVPTRARFLAFLVAYCALQLTLLVSAVVACIRLQLPPASGMIVMCEATRLAMKAHAYLREKIVHGVTALAELQARGRLVAEAAARRAHERSAVADAPFSAAAESAPAAAAPMAALTADELVRKRSERSERRASLRSRLTGPSEPEPEPVHSATPKRHVHMAAEAEAEAAGSGAAVPAALEAPLRLAPLAAALVRFRDFSGARAPPAAVKASQPHVRIGSWRAELRRFAFFLVAPTMIYRDAYPRTPAVDSLALLGYVGGFLATVAFCLLVVRGMVEPALASLSPRPKTLAAYFVVVFSMMAPAALLFLSLFFAVLHCWLNAIAVALRFADRRFYSSWWTASTWGAWYRKWNSVVGEWMFHYLFLDAQRLGARRGAALAVVFLVSGVLHELILAAAFGFFLPALFVFFAGPGVALLWATRWLSPRLGNAFLWLALSLGVSLLFVLYVDEGILRNGGHGRRDARDTSLLERVYDAVVPRSWRAWAA